jgi:hypothetical protein
VIALEVLTAVSVAGLVAIAAKYVLQAVAYLRLHHPIANKRFMARYRASLRTQDTCNASTIRPAAASTSSAAAGRALTTPTPADSTRARRRTS